MSTDYLFAEAAALPLAPGPRPVDNRDGSKQRQKLLSASLYETAERGVSKVQVSHIVRRAKVSSRSFYEHFSNKEEALLAVFDDGAFALDAAMRLALSLVSEPCGRLRAALTTATDFFTRNPALTSLMLVDLSAIGTDGIDRHAGLVRIWAMRLRLEVDSARSNDSRLADAVDGFTDSLSLAVVSGVEELFRAWLDTRKDQRDVLREGLSLVLSVVAKEPRIAAEALLSESAEREPISGK